LQLKIYIFNSFDAFTQQFKGHGLQIFFVIACV